MLKMLDEADEFGKDENEDSDMKFIREMIHLKDKSLIINVIEAIKIKINKEGE